MTSLEASVRDLLEAWGQNLISGDEAMLQLMMLVRDRERDESASAPSDGE